MRRWSIAVAVAGGLLALSSGLFVALHSGVYQPGRRHPEPRAELGPSTTPPPRVPITGEPTVVVMLFDGLAPALVEAHDTPALDRLRREGAWTHHFVPAFPTVSATNGVTITTGCWPEHHGIVHNRFIDPERGLYDHDRDAAWLTGCEPIHAVAQRQDVPVASIGWYADWSSEAGWLVGEANSPAPNNDYPPDEERAARTVELLRRPAERRPRLILTYLRGSDDLAHRHGLGSPQVVEKLLGIDRAVAQVLDAIETQGLRDQVTLIVTTDHGMRPAHRLVNLERILHREGVRATTIASGAVGFVYLDDPTRVDQAAERIGAYDALTAYRPEQLPAWSHVGRGPRVGHLVVVASPPYVIEDRSVWPPWSRWLAVWGPRFADAGPWVRASHGYPPDTPGMHGLLYVWGRDTPRARLPQADVVDLHPTLARLLGIEPGRPVDGRVIEELFVD